MNPTGSTPPLLVAHRGYAGRYPENTLPAVEAALRAGVRYVEVDVQLTADRVPVLFHDDTLDRTTGRTGRISEIFSDQLARIPAGEVDRLGPRFSETPIPTLDDLIRLLSGWPEANVFVEIKEGSLEAFGHAAVVETVMRAIGTGKGRFIPISFDAEALRLARTLGAPRIGWVLRRYDAETSRFAADFAPEFLICNYRKLPPGIEPLWQGPWRWILYEITNPTLARRLGWRGADFIESMRLDAYTGEPWFLSIDE
jgi:glycerophosphoryl diester phosphodiesterase